MTREEFYKTAEVMDKAKNIIRALEVIDLQTLEEVLAAIQLPNVEEKK